MRDTAGCLRPFWVVTIHKTAINRLIEGKDLKSLEKKTKTKIISKTTYGKFTI